MPLDALRACRLGLCDFGVCDAKVRGSAQRSRNYLKLDAFSDRCEAKKIIGVPVVLYYK